MLTDERLSLLLAQAGFFRRMTPAQRDVLASMATVQALPAGEAIYKVGDVAQHLYVLMDGMVRFSLPMGQRQVTAGEVIRRGDVFGWAALIEGAQQRIATASCITACTALAIDGHRLIERMSVDHSLGYAVMREVSLLVTSTLTAYAAG
jgi:toluene monooxygenase system ferredoxin subunit